MQVKVQSVLAGLPMIAKVIAQPAPRQLYWSC